MFKAVSANDIRVETTQVVFLMKKDVPMNLTEVQYHAAMQHGAVPVAEKEEPAPPPEPAIRSEMEIKEDIQVAIQTILDEGGELSKLTKQPKIGEIRKTVPDATPALRDEVWGEYFTFSE